MADSNMLGTIKPNNQANLVHKNSMCLLKKVEDIPIKPIIKATNKAQFSLVMIKTTKNPTLMVSMVFTGLDFIFCMVKIKYK